MNKQMKRRLGVTTGIIVVVLIVVLALVGGSGSAKAVTVADIASGSCAGETVQVSGNVVDDSFSTQNNVLTFLIYDAQGDATVQVPVRYEGAVSATFGNQVTAICTGTVAEDGTLNATELVTKCPSKYEDSAEALGVDQLLGYGETVFGKVVKVTGVITAGSLQPAGSEPRFVMADEGGAGQLSVLYDGALPDECDEGAVLVLTGTLSEEGIFTASEVALGA